MPVIETGVPTTAALTAPAIAKMALVRSQEDYLRYVNLSDEANDLKGVQGSLYTGKYFSPGLEAKRKCIVDRESSGVYTVVNPTGSYRGAYQMSRALSDGVTWMMLDEHKDLLGADAAKQVLETLRSKPINEWNRYWQDAAFSTIANWEGTGSGLKHWGGGRWNC